MNHPSDPLPLLPAELLRRYSCAEPTDTRFRAIARLRQSLWREQHGYACGRYVESSPNNPFVIAYEELWQTLKAAWQARSLRGAVLRLSEPP